MSGYTPFRRVRSALLRSSADIFAFQEFCDAEKKLKSIPWARDYEAFIPRLNRSRDHGVKGFNYNVILSRHPIIRAEEMPFPQSGNGVHLESCVKADIRIGADVLRLYNCHFGIGRVGIASRLRQLKHILLDCRDHRGPAVICGDMNVTVPAPGWNRRVICAWHREPESDMSVDGRYIDHDERELFSAAAGEHGFKDVLDLYTPTWSPFKTRLWELFKLKLDWFMIKGLKTIDAKLGEYVSDHRAMEVRVGFKLSEHPGH